MCWGAEWRPRWGPRGFMRWTPSLECLDQSWGRGWNSWKLLGRNTIQNLPWCMEELRCSPLLHHAEKPSPSCLFHLRCCPLCPLQGIPRPQQKGATFRGGSRGRYRSSSCINWVAIWVLRPPAGGGTGAEWINWLPLCLAWDVRTRVVQD